jgi:DNA-binding response OmpR family regulator/signal transduction histidine kinase
MRRGKMLILAKLSQKTLREKLDVIKWRYKFRFCKERERIIYREKLDCVCKAVFENFALPVAVFDKNKVLWGNDAFLEFCGITEREILDQKIIISEIIAASETEEGFDSLQDLDKDKANVGVYIKDRQGISTPSLISIGKIDCKDEEAITYIVMCPILDLDDLIESKANQLSYLVDNLTSGLCYVNIEGLIAEANDSLANMLGIQRNQIIGLPYQILFAKIIGRAAEPVIVQRELQHAIINLKEKPRIAFSLKLSRIRYFEMSFFPVYTKKGKVNGWGSILQDNTLMKEQTNWKSELLSNLSQNIYSPLAIIKGHATALRDNFQQWNAEMVQEFLEEIDRGIDVLTRKVDRNLALSRIESGKLGLRPAKLDPQTLVENAIERIASALEPFDVEIDLPNEKVSIRADVARMEEVLVNLLENAVQFSPLDKPIVVRVGIENNYVCFEVRDYGPGISRQDQERIFNKMLGDKASNMGEELGLFLSKKIVEAHGGSIWINSPPVDGESGTSVLFTTPRMPDVLVDQVSATDPIESETGLARAGTVLVIENEPDLQALYRSILSEEGYRIEFALNGQMALDLLESVTYDIAILKWSLSDMDGLNLCRNVRRFSNIPIIMIGTREDKEDLVDALDAGADDYIARPFSSDELLARMRSALRWRIPREEKKDELRMYSSEDLVVDFEAHQVWAQGEEVELTSMEFNLLAILLKSPRQVFTYQQLIEAIWSVGQGGRHALSVHISRLRKKIERDPKHPKYIKTKWGVGYLLMPED